MLNKLVIAGTNSGVGKTTITMGLIAALRRRGRRVQPFKSGPDYIDPTYHTLAAGVPCRNVDTWMVPPQRALALFHQAAQSADIALIEGVMGIFDGFSYETEEGSSAQIAKLTGSPVLLILDVGKVARSAGAIALGYTKFDPGLNIAGFILNRCGSDGHYQGVKLAVEQAAGLPVVGWLPKNAELHIPERHLGLVPTDERGELSDFIAHAAEMVEHYFDLDHILKIAAATGSPQTRSQLIESGNTEPSTLLKTALTSSPSPSGIQGQTDHQTFRAGGDSTPSQPPPARGRSQNRSPSGGERGGENASQTKLFVSEPSGRRGSYLLKIAVARDAAFSFYYEDNLDLLRALNAEIIFFSPLTDSQLPQGSSGLYLGGGFPEMHAAQLAENTSLQAAIRQANAAEMPIYAECGGFMFLTEAIIDLEGSSHTMVGLVPGLTRMQPRLMSLGYRVVESPTGNFLLPKGAATRGHEFHWSSWETSSASPAWHIRPRRGTDTFKPDGYAAGNLIASYVHLHFAHNLDLARNFVAACRQWQNG